MRVGIIGGGQLGRMTALAGYPLGIRARCLDKTADAPAGEVAELVVGAYDDPAALARLADGCTVVTYEFENVPAGPVGELAGSVPVLPHPRALAVAQDRIEEKRCFQHLGIPTPDYLPVANRAEAEAAARQLGVPLVLKTRRLGYDGKGQEVVRAAAEAPAAFDRLGGVPLIAEAFVAFDRELSVLAVRGRDGSLAFYPLVWNEHEGGILRRSTAPAPDVDPAAQRAAEEYARAVLEELDYTGVLAIELFDRGGELLANEMAPRVHNSGHWTIEGAETSQFENHLRAVAGFPLGSTAARGRSVMLNILGRRPRAADILAIPGAHLHDYGKGEAPRRKIGHVTVTAENARALAERVRRVAAVLETAGA